MSWMVHIIDEKSTKYKNTQWPVDKLKDAASFMGKL
jgi:hypothetical protein